jgi:hypothetical protein
MPIQQFTYAEINTITNGFRRPIAHGGYSNVYKGALPDGTPVAVKRLLSPDGQDAEQDLRVFQAELDALAFLHHTSLISSVGYCYDHGDADMPVDRAIVFPLLTPLTAGVLRALPPHERAFVMQHVAEALAYMHSCGCIHRDVKPANILHKKDDAGAVVRAYLADLGITRRLGAGRTHGTVTQVVGTAGFLDPDCLDRAHARKEHDVYAFGVTYRCVAAGVMWPGQDGAAALLSDLPPAVRAAADAMASGDPAARPTADLLASVMMRAFATPGHAAPPPLPPVAATVRYVPVEGTSTAALLAAVQQDGATFLEANFGDCKAAVDDDVVRTIAEHCPQLTKLYAYGCSAITNVGLVAIAEHCPQLTELSVGGTAITNVGVGAVVDHCPKLTKLYIYGCSAITDVGLVAIAEHCPQLTELSVHGCSAITDVGLVVIAELCPRLTGLTVGGTAITDVGVGAVAERCPRLMPVTR